MAEVAPVLIVDYDPEWPALFERELALLEDAFAGADAVVEHVGSTAVPGLAAKPIVDIMLGVLDLAEVESRIDALAERGYHYVPEYEAQLPERRYFRKPHDRPRRYHLHAVVREGDFWRRHLIFRDHLRRHAEVAVAYGVLKRRLAAKYGADRHAYAEAKSPFIEATLVAAGLE